MFGTGSKAAGKTLREIEAALSEADAQVVGLVCNGMRLIAPNPSRIVRADDILVIEADADALANAQISLGLKLEEAKREKPKANAARKMEQDEKESDNGKRGVGKNGGQEAEAQADMKEEKPLPSDEIALVEIVVLPQSKLVGRSATELLLRTRYGINLLVVSRQGQRSMARLSIMRLAVGDVLLMQGPPEAIFGFAGNVGCVPMTRRTLRLPDKRMAITATGIMLLAVGAAAFGAAAIKSSGFPKPSIHRPVLGLQF